MLETLIVTLPILFIGHGSPMNAIENNIWSTKWRELGSQLTKPQSILVISAHWQTHGIRVTGNYPKQKTIYDFGGFPNALYQAKYAPPGDEKLCKRILELIPEAKIDNSWGLDHGSWSILKQMYPKEEIPTIQLSLSLELSENEHFEIGKRLRELRREGVLIIGSGNIVHNLYEVDWNYVGKGYDWATKFHNRVKSAIAAQDYNSVIQYKKIEDYKKSVPSSEHYLPILYILGLKEDNDKLTFFNDELEMGSLSMLSILVFILATWKSIEYLILPDYDQIIHSTRQLTIYRDSHGIPHIHGKTLEDTIFGLGFTQAQDRLWQMETRRLVSKGELSSVLGEKALNIDILFRGFDYLDSCQRIWDKMDKQTKQLLQAYSDGINEGVESLWIYPIEFWIFGNTFKKWHPIDSIAIIKLHSIILINDYHLEIIRQQMFEHFDRETIDIITGVGPHNQYRSNISVIDDEDYKKQIKYTFNQSNSNNTQYNNIASIFKELDLINDILPTMSGSNAWVIHGNYTTTGFPMLASDPHLDNSLPTNWYQAELYFEDNYLIGGSFVGFPMIMIGRSKYHAWGTTILYSDTSDIYEEQLKEINGQIYYLYKGEWLPTKQNQQQIQIKGQQEYHNITIYRTHHGPILNIFYDARGDKSFHQFNQQNKYYSLSTLVDQDDIYNFKAFFDFFKIPDLKTALKSLTKIIYPSLAMVFCSQKDIAYMPIGKLIHKAGHPSQYAYIKEGWTGESEWISIIPENEHPILMNPSKGYYATANSIFFKDPFTYGITPTARADRLEFVIPQLLKNKVSVQQMIQLQLDVIDNYVLQTLPNLLSLLTNNTKNQQFFYNQLSSWNASFDLDSTQASLYTLFEYYYLQTLDNVPKRIRATYVIDSFYFKQLTNFTIQAKWCKNQDCLTNLRSSVEKAVDHFHSLSDKSWSAIHSQYFPHMPFAGKFFGLFDDEIPFLGNRRTVQVSGFDTTEFPFRGVAGSNLRMVVSMRPGDVGQFIVDTGISGNIFSPHYRDQNEIWYEGRFVKMSIGQPYYEITKFIKVKKDL